MGIKQVFDPRDTQPLLCDWMHLAYAILQTQLSPKPRFDPSSGPAT
ncbi:MAG: hypothetical protein ACI95C_001580 [Pseudohongiellaceae bacterium]|jgi:hypothetical protein